MFISKVDIVKLSDENITRKEYSLIQKQITNAVDEIWRYIIKVTPGRHLSWWAFSNDVEYGNGNGSSGGEFDPDNDNEFIEIIGENSRYDNKFYEYNDGFPTEFLWSECFKSTVIKHIEDAKQLLSKHKTKNRECREKGKKEKEEIINKIKDKLTKEEFKILKNSLNHV